MQGLPEDEKSEVNALIKQAVGLLIDAQISLLMGVRPIVRYEELTETHGTEFVELLRTIEQAESLGAKAQNLLANM